MVYNFLTAKGKLGILKANFGEIIKKMGRAKGI